MSRDDIDRLLQSGDLPGAGRRGRLLETHISWVLLSGAFAFKIKKPVRFSFLDFSTLEKRRQFIEAEWRLNRRLAPDVYLAVLPVWRTAEGQLQIAEQGEGEVVDYALQMKRLDMDRQMDVLLEQGAVTFAHMEQLAGILADFHRRARTVHLPDLVGDLYRRYADLADNLAEISDWLGPDTAARIEASIGFAERFLEVHRDRLLQRHEEGWVVDGHGDLHSRNIFLLETEPVVFDCIEFDESLRALDVLNELAFFCLDLDFHRRSDLKDHFMASYLARNPAIAGEEDVQLFHYFKMYRANVRLKVNILGAAPGQEGKRAELKRYADLLLGYRDYLT